MQRIQVSSFQTLFCIPDFHRQAKVQGINQLLGGGVLALRVLIPQGRLGSGHSLYADEQS